MNSIDKTENKHHQIDSIGGEILKRVKKNLEWWIIVLGISTILGFILHPIFPIAAGAIYIIYLSEKVRGDFWRRFAAQNGWVYTEVHNISEEKGVMFRAGNHRLAKHMIESVINGVKVRIFNYMFRIGHGRNARSYHYTVFEFRTSGSFPHIYLNRKWNMYGVDVGEKISLPFEFEKKFELRAPKKYEMEALQIFTPDTLEHLLSIDFKYDVELVDKDVIFYVSGRIGNVKKLKLKLEQMIDTYKRLASRLDRMKVHPIGDIPHYL